MDELLPMSVLQLDLPAPSTGWHAFLTQRHIPVRLDDVGRESVTREAARRLFVEAREVEAESARKREIAERQAVEADEQRRAQIWGGIPASEIPDGLTPVMVMTAGEREARPRRRSLLEDSLLAEG